MQSREVLGRGTIPSAWPGLFILLTLTSVGHVYRLCRWNQLRLSPLFTIEGEVRPPSKMLELQ